jgi:outer membrane biosynthesis protein TonB
MSLALTTFLLSAMLASAPAVRNAWPEAQDASKQAQAGTLQSNESNSPEQHAPVSEGQQTNPAEQGPSQQVPAQPPSQPETKTPQQAPELSPSSPDENPTPSQPQESKPAEVALPEQKPKAGEAAKPASQKSRKKKTPRKTKAQSSKPKKVIVRNGGTAETISQLAPDMSTSDASHARDTTNQLLTTTEANLQRASTRQLNQAQLATVEQIRMFMGQSNAAVKAGDLQRGHNLAMKALLLSNDLVKQ